MFRNKRGGKIYKLPIALYHVYIYASGKLKQQLNAYVRVVNVSKSTNIGLLDVCVMQINHIPTASQIPCDFKNEIRPSISILCCLSQTTR